MNEMKKIFLLSNTEQLNTGPEPTPHYHPSFTLFRHASQSLDVYVVLLNGILQCILSKKKKNILTKCIVQGIGNFNKHTHTHKK